MTPSNLRTTPISPSRARTTRGRGGGRPRGVSQDRRKVSGHGLHDGLQPARQPRRRRRRVAGGVPAAASEAQRVSRLLHVHDLVLPPGAERDHRLPAALPKVRRAARRARARRRPRGRGPAPRRLRARHEGARPTCLPTIASRSSCATSTGCATARSPTPSTGRSARSRPACIAAAPRCGCVCGPAARIDEEA